MCDALATWARYLMQIDPTLAGQMYRTLADAWAMNRAGLYTDNNDPRDRITVGFHRLFLEAATLALGDEPYESPSALGRQEQAAQRAEQTRRAALVAGEMAARLRGEEVTPPRVDNSEQIAELRERLARLDEEDDQIIRCSERFKLEKQIFDLEHEADTDEWPTVIGGDE